MASFRLPCIDTLYHISAIFGAYVPIMESLSLLSSGNCQTTPRRELATDAPNEARSERHGPKRLLPLPTFFGGRSPNALEAPPRKRAERKAAGGPRRAWPCAAPARREAERREGARRKKVFVFFRCADRRAAQPCRACAVGWWPGGGTPGGRRFHHRQPAADNADDGDFYHVASGYIFSFAGLTFL